jgi:hypothetical protein
MKKILVISMKAGLGHIKAAQALAMRQNVRGPATATILPF